MHKEERSVLMVVMSIAGAVAAVAATALSLRALLISAGNGPDVFVFRFAALLFLVLSAGFVCVNLVPEDDGRGVIFLVTAGLLAVVVLFSCLQADNIWTHSEEGREAHAASVYEEVDAMVEERLAVISFAEYTPEELQLKAGRVLESGLYIPVSGVEKRTVTYERGTLKHRRTYTQSTWSQSFVLKADTE